ncbi:tripartite tricarboxylate transporter substrate-binding protein [Cupriavidus consociatus]|uniref:tripartite tricarboxylate transporter substrate-binding protein n=1 Tax=Cupriavidus consociatus TaxID=2821357 RepID=UPI001AE46FA4|nr:MULTISPECIES: tripartite tricarboxylate transporter substrate-binding protein [unclassified Cupriavidus]MBP0620628.1 tripartite tricarboxylate transporter substrate binding protein BugD [Cupriavidus sp. LEh25]MDK2657288.1 tripartite tricarboxylate transporter substrate-binding protein [Cupriavidus sp. LEh21]
MTVQIPCRSTRKSTPRRLRRLATAAITAAVAATPALAQTAAYPARPIALIVPFPAGGPSDALARGIARHMGEQLGQTIVIENLAGAGGTVGLARAAKATPDGYTLALGTIGTHVANVALYRKLPYDPVADFRPVGMAGSAPLLLLARAGLPASNLQQFSAWLRSHAGKATYGSAGVGSVSHYGCGMLLAAMKQEVTHAPYRGVAPAISDLMGGQIDFMCDQTTTALPQLAGGKIKALAVLSGERLKQLPAVATAKEAGYPLDLRSWNALFVPKGTPDAIVARLNTALAAASAEPSLRRQMQAVGVELPAPGTTAPDLVSDQIARGLRDDVPALKARGQFLD